MTPPRDTPSATPLRIGILYPGEMGSALAGVLRANGAVPISVVTDRSPRTQQLAIVAAVELRNSLAEVVAEADVLLSTTTPAAALSLAKEVASLQPKPGAIYVDANSIAPATMEEVAQVCASAGLSAVDMAIRGLASSLPERGAVYLSGERSGEIAALLRPLEIERLSDKPGDASRLKMMMSGMSKGVAALFIELGLAAGEADMLPRFLAGVKRYYPDVYAAMQAVLPTYPQHIGRRAQELGEVAASLTALGASSHIAAGGRHTFEAVAQSKLPALSSLIRALQSPLPPISSPAATSTCEGATHG